MLSGNAFTFGSQNASKPAGATTTPNPFAANPFASQGVASNGLMSSSFASNPFAQPFKAPNPVSATPPSGSHQNHFGREIESLLKSKGIVPPTWPTDTPGDPSQKVVMEAFWQSMKAYRAKVRTTLIASGKIDDPDKPKRLEDAIDFKGTCEDMCPEFEKITRINEHDVQGPEKELAPGGKTMWPSPRKMVKALARSAAGQDAPLPEDIRSPGALRRTVNYLISDVLGSNDLATVHGFLWDRTRAIRRDFVFLQASMTAEELKDQIYCLETITRFHVVALHQMVKANVSAEGFSEQQEVEQLGKSLLSLIQAYEDCAIQNVECSNEAEFRAYYVLFNSHNPAVLETVQDWDYKYWGESGEVKIAVHLVESLQNVWDDRGPLRPHTPTTTALSGYSRFFSVLKDAKVSYIMACFAEIHLNRIRKAVLKTILTVCKRPKDDPKYWTLRELNKYLHFDQEDDIVTFGEAYGLHFVDDAEASYLSISQSSNIMDDPFPQLKQPHSKSVVEYKRAQHSLPECIQRTIYSTAQPPQSASLASSTKPSSFAANATPFSTPPPSLAGINESRSQGDSPAVTKARGARVGNNAFTFKPMTTVTAAAVDSPAPAFPKTTFGSSSQLINTPFSFAQQKHTGQNATIIGPGASAAVTQPAVTSLSEISSNTSTVGLPTDTSESSHEAMRGATNKDVSSPMPFTDKSNGASGQQPLPTAFGHNIGATKSAAQKEIRFSFPAGPGAPAVSANASPAPDPMSKPQGGQSTSPPKVQDSQIKPEKSIVNHASEPRVDPLDPLTRWMVLGGNGIMDQWTLHITSDLLSGLYTTFRNEQLELKAKQEHARIEAQVIAFRRRSLSIKYGYRWRMHAQRRWLRRRGHIDREKRRQFAEQQARDTASKLSEKVKRAEGVVNDFKASVARTSAKRRVSEEGASSSATSSMLEESMGSNKSKRQRRALPNTILAPASHDDERQDFDHSCTQSESSMRQSRMTDTMSVRDIMVQSFHNTSRIGLIPDYDPALHNSNASNGVISPYFRLKARGIVTLPDGSPLARSAAMKSGSDVGHHRSSSMVGLRPLTKSKVSKRTSRKSGSDIGGSQAEMLWNASVGSMSKPFRPKPPSQYKATFSSPSNSAAGASQERVVEDVQEEVDLEKVKLKARAIMEKQTKQYEDSKRKQRLSGITDDELFAKARKLREAMDEESEWFREQSRMISESEA